MLSGRLSTALVLAASLGSGVVGGVLFGFSAFVMRGLDRLPPERAIAAMQQINREAPRAPLLVPLMGTGAVCVVLAALAAVSLRSGSSRRAVLVLTGCALYLVAFGITAGYHVPHNDALALVDPGAADAARTWRAYAGPWLALNHVRAAAAILGAAALAAAVATD